MYVAAEARAEVAVDSTAPRPLKVSAQVQRVSMATVETAPAVDETAKTELCFVC